MANIHKYNKATVHMGNAGVTVYGDAARIIEGNNCYCFNNCTCFDQQSFKVI